ncbi:MAG TPA: hypothetical protein VEV43_06315 [Actinomycetota bacterium]|nr:hypothetical protein [Actinomycetota bacterium]
MRVSRLLIACLVAACSAVPLASPALAQDPECPSDWAGQYLLSLIPPIPAFEPVEFDEETITIRGDLVAGEAAALIDHYVSNTETFLTCLQEYVDGLVSPYADCVSERSAPVLTSPDPVGRYVEVGADLVVKVHYAQAMADVVAIFNCNDIVTYGDTQR